MSTGPRPVQFTRQSAERIAAVVRQAELTPFPGSPLEFDPVANAQGKKTFRICTFTGAWSTESSKTVTFKYQTTTPNTVSATNLFFEIGTATETRDCAIAKDGTAWHLVQIKQGDVEEIDVVYDVTIDGSGLTFNRKKVLVSVVGTAEDFVVPLINCGE